MNALTNMKTSHMRNQPAQQEERGGGDPAWRLMRRNDAGVGGLRPLGLSTSSFLQALSAQQKRLLEQPATDAEEGILYQHSVLCQTCLPYRNPGDTNRRWIRRNGYLKMEVDAGRAFDARVSDFVDIGLPYGPKPRLVLYHLNAEALRTQSPVIELEDTLTAFVRRTLGLDAQQFLLLIFLDGGDADTRPARNDFFDILARDNPG